jgi:hypothetical protein
LTGPKFRTDSVTCIHAASTPSSQSV